MSRFVRRGSKAPARPAKRSVRLQLEVLEDRTFPATFNVGAGDTATLIADINTANSNGQSNTINLTASTYVFNSANNNTFGPNALPAITGNITIVGNGAVLQRPSSLGQNSPFRLFYVSGSQVASPSGSQSTGAAMGNLTLQNLTLEGGLAVGGSSGTGGGGLGAGGAIFNMGNLTLDGVTVEQNYAAGGYSGVGTSATGGGLGANATGSGNFGVGGAGSSGGVGGFGSGGGSGSSAGAGGFGGGNGSGSEGGGGAGLGGAIFDMYGTTTLINSTVANNLAEGGQGATVGDGFGGAIFNVNSTLNVISSTIANNSTVGAANGGGAVYNLAMGGNSPVTLTDSILSDSVGSNDLVNDQNNSTTGSATVNATAPNIVVNSSNINGASAVTGTPITSDPQLGLLSNNGGPTQTMALLSGSPALGAGAATVSGVNVPMTDQRGTARGNVYDLGAYQSTPSDAVATTLTLSSSTPTTSSGSSVTLTATVSASSANTVPSGNVQFVDVTAKNTTLGTAVLINGVATLVTTGVSSGDTITATYLPNNSTGMANSRGSFTIPVASSSGGSSGSTGGSGSGSTGGSTTGTVNTQFQPWLNAVYQALLHRPIDSQGLTQWTNALNGGTTPTQVVIDIEQTTEYQTDEVQNAYQQLLGVAAPSSAVDYLVGLMKAGANFTVVESIIAGSYPFYAAAGGTNDSFLNAVYEDFLQRQPDPSSEKAWSALMTAGYSPIAVVYGILSSPEYLNDLVTQDYMTYMGVGPDPNSQAAFEAALQNGTMNNDMVVASLLGSPEWMSKTATTSTPTSSTSG